VGFVAHVRGERSHKIVSDALIMLQHMDHRGACGCEANTGDGAGILTALPHDLLADRARADLGTELPEPGRYAAGNVFLPRDQAERARCKEQVERIITEQGQMLIGWRAVPTDPEGADIGPSAKIGEPVTEQLFLAAADGRAGEAFERAVYMIRKRASHELRHSDLAEAKTFYICSLSTKVMVYKGMLTSTQVPLYYPDLRDPAFTSHLAMVHSRFSTNTFPSWDRAQPNRFMSHNGEINTLQGNTNWMFARQGVLRDPRPDGFGEDLQSLLPVVEPDCSDSGTFDNVLEFHLMTGRTLQEAVMMMVPEAWQNHESMPVDKRAFYEYHACLQEPWDGPASIAFTDGKYIGAVLDRNGLRPSRYYITDDDLCVMASEIGVLPEIDPASVKIKGRLRPGRMFLIDFEEGRLVPDDELKAQFAARRPYRRWLRDRRIVLDELNPHAESHGFDPDSLLERMQAFGYTLETMRFMLTPLVTVKKDPVGSMGNDAALAVLSDKPRLIYDYFKQLFAQVTNPAIDSIREEMIMSLECYIGPEGNLLETTEAHAHRLLVPHPILTNEQLASIKHIDQAPSGRGWRTRTIDITWDRHEGAAGLVPALDRVCAEAEQAIEDGEALIVLSDRGIGPDRVPISALLATGAVHHHLVNRAKRTRIGIVVETGEAREVHHHCLLVGYGADAINPYLAFESLWQARRDGMLPGVFDDDDPIAADTKIVAAYRKGVAKGMLKVMAKMGISTLHSYKGAQIFEAVGLDEQVVQRCFCGTASRIRGVGLSTLAEELLRRHAIGYPPRRDVTLPVLPNDGQFHWRADGERHGLDPAAIGSLQQASRTNTPEDYWRFAEYVDKDSVARCTLRGLLDFRDDRAGEIPLDEVEPASEIVKRFRTGAMSYGSISAEAHETLAIAMNRIHAKSNTGEGGEQATRYTVDLNGDSRRSSIKQVASGRFGVTSWYLTNADELQIKIVQGAKPGEGGELPGHKVDQIIAECRHATPGVGLISPPPHHDIYSIEDLAQLIHDLKNANPAADISVKLVSEIGVGTVAAGVAKAKADHILVSGHDGGTGASPLTSIKHAGLPWELGIAETHQTLVMNDLRSRVSLETDGQIKTGRDVAIAAMLGAETFGMSTAPLVTLGCIMMRKCHLNTCPVGIATQDPELRKKFEGKPEHVINYLFMVAEHLRRIMAGLGVRRLVDLVGRVDLLKVNAAVDHWKARGLDLSAILAPARPPDHREHVGVYKQMVQDHGIDDALDHKLIDLARPALQRGEKVSIDLPVQNINRVVGTMLSHEVSRAHGEQGLPDETIRIRLHGSAGQSLGAWLGRGVSIELEGDANDYVGKGLCGGRLIVYPPAASRFTPEENIIIGNVALYGATSGEAYFRGLAAERFAVRNSGASAVVEGAGDHGCEYMTGGRVVVLGPTGRNFAAGMSGGMAYIHDPHGKFLANCNLAMVELEAVEQPDDIQELRRLIDNHRRHTGSTVAARILDRWDQALGEFVKVMPIDLKRVLAERITHDDEAEAEVHDWRDANHDQRVEATGQR
jgi:glutamate synthase (NADPH/NADH) large chain